MPWHECHGEALLAYMRRRAQPEAVDDLGKTFIRTCSVHVESTKTNFGSVVASRSLSFLVFEQKGLCTTAVKRTQTKWMSRLYRYFFL